MICWYLSKKPEKEEEGEEEEEEEEGKEQKDVAAWIRGGKTVFRLIKQQEQNL